VVRVTLKSQAANAATRMHSTWTVREVLEWTTGYFRRADIDSARFEAELLLSHALCCERINLYLDPNRPLSESERSKYRALVMERQSGVPMAYLIGTAQFLNANLKVNESVLIPRPETEELVEVLLKDHSDWARERDSFSFLDLGTGSGAIVISLLMAWDFASATAVDNSPAALEVANENAESNGVANRVIYLISDWFEKVEGKYDLIVSNPPYIPTPNLSSLSDEVIDHEPRTALDGGPQGTREIEAIVRDAVEYLLPGGWLYLEIGYDQGELVREILTKSGQFQAIEILPDLGGRDRIARVQLRAD